jgi:hypothetical protein
MPHDGSLQAVLPTVCFGQAGKADAGASAKGIHTSNKLNKMAVNFFTIEFDFSRNNAGCDYFFCVSSASLIFFMYVSGSAKKRDL